MRSVRGLTLGVCLCIAGCQDAKPLCYGDTWARAGWQREWGAGSIEGIWGSDASNVFAVGEVADSSSSVGSRAVVLRSSGNGTWYPVTAPDASFLFDVWGSGTSDLYVTGQVPAPQGMVTGVIVHSKDGGATWITELEASGGDGAGQPPIGPLWGSGPADIYAGSCFNGGGSAAILHSSGNGVWSTVTVPRCAMSLWGSGPGDVYFGAYSGDLFHSVGTGTWTIEASLGDVTAPNVQIWAIGGSGPGDLYVGGTGYTPTDMGGSPRGSLWHSSDGTTWTLEADPVEASITALWSNGPGDAFAVTTTDSNCGGLILHRSPTGTWDQVATSADSMATLWGTGPTNVYTGGAGGILHLVH